MAEETTSRGERTQAQILQAAMRLFIDHGYHGTSMRQIAAEAGVALSGIYNHFASKEDIFLAGLFEWNPFHDVMPALVAAQGKTIEAFVWDAANRLVAQTQDRIDFLNLMFIELVEFKGKHLPQLVQNYFQNVLRFTERFLEGKAELRPIPPLMLVRAFIGLFFSYVMTELMIARQLPPEMQENALEYFVEIYLHGILAKDAPKEV